MGAPKNDFADQFDLGRRMLINWAMPESQRIPQQANEGAKNLYSLI